MARSYPFTLLVILLCFGCSKHYYSPALYKNDIAYQFKPMSSDSLKSANYLTATIYTGIGDTKDNMTYGRLSFNRSNTYKNFNIAYGGYGVFGDYKNYDLNDIDAGYFKNKYLSALGLRFSADTYYTEGNADIREIGIELAYSKEFGQYKEFRASGKDQPYIYTDARTSVLTAGVTNEIIWHNKNNRSTQYGYRFYLGTVIGNHDFINNNDPINTYSPLPFYKNIVAAGTGFVQIGHFQFIAENQNISSITFSLGYKF